MARVDHRQLAAGEEVDLLPVDVGVAGQGVALAVGGEAQTVVAGRRQADELELVAVDGERAGRQLVHLDRVAIGVDQRLGAEQLEPAVDQPAQPGRPPEMEVAASRVGARPGAGLHQRHQVGDVIGVEMRDDDVAQLVLAVAERGQPGGDAAAAVEHQPHTVQLDERRRGGPAVVELAGPGSQQHQPAHGRHSNPLASACPAAAAAPRQGRGRLRFGSGSRARVTPQSESQPNLLWVYAMRICDARPNAVSRSLPGRRSTPRALAVLLAGVALVSCQSATEKAKEELEKRVALVSVHYDEETTSADKKLVDYLEKKVRKQDHPTFELELDQRRYAAAITRLIDRSADSAFVARLTPYVFVVAEMLGAEFDVLGTYRSDAVMRSFRDPLSSQRDDGYTYKSYIVVNKEAFKDRLKREIKPGAETLQALEEYFRSFQGRSQPNFLYHSKFSTSSFFLPSVYFRNRGIIDLGLRTEDISKGREREVISSKELVRRVADADAGSDHLVAAVWDGTKAYFEGAEDARNKVDQLKAASADAAAIEKAERELAPLKKAAERAANVVFIALEQELPNDLLAVSASMTPELRRKIRRAVEIMEADFEARKAAEEDQQREGSLLDGDFLFWKPMDVDETARARSALAGLRQLARSQVAPVTVRIAVLDKRGQEVEKVEQPQVRRELRRLRQAAEDAVRLSGSEFVLWSEYYEHADFDWIFQPTHDGAVVLTSEIGGLERLKQEFQISFKDEKDLTERVGDLIRSRMHRIRYVWAYSESDAPTILRDVDFSVPKDGTIQVQKIRWSNRDTNHFVIEKEFPARLVEEDARRFVLSGERFDEGINAMGSISYRAVLPRPSEERPLFTILTAALIVLFLAATVAAALEFRRAPFRSRAAASSDVIDDAFASSVRSYHQPWRPSGKLVIAEADVLGQDRDAIEEFISELKLAEGPWWKRLARRVTTDEGEDEDTPTGLTQELLVQRDEIGGTTRLAGLIEYLVRRGELSGFTGSLLEFEAWNRAACELFSRAVEEDRQPDPAGSPVQLLHREGACLSRLVSRHFDGVLAGARRSVSLFERVWQTRQDPDNRSIWIWRCEEQLPVALDSGALALAENVGDDGPIDRLLVEFKMGRPVNLTIIDGQLLEAWLLGVLDRRPAVVDNAAGQKCLRLHFKPLALLRGPE